MVHDRRLTRSGVAGLVALLLLAACAVAERQASAQPASSDPRQRLVLPPAARDLVLAEMRRMLESVNGVVQGAAASDLEAIERAARASGMTMAADVDPRVMQALPPFFRQLGMQTHRGFDELADRMRAGGTRDDALRALAGLTNNCVACHATFRLDEAR